MRKLPVDVDRPLPSEKPLPEIVAGVDLGSNSFHMVVAELRHGQLVVLERLREAVRLAEGLSPRNKLHNDARQRALHCLSRFGKHLRNLDVAAVRAAGTSTFRRVHDDTDFLSQAAKNLGHPIEVISGLEEARLVYAGVARTLPENDAPRLVVDIGGGSTEIILGQAYEPRTMQSLQLGCVSMSERFFPGGEISRAGFLAARRDARLQLEPINERFRSIANVQVIGTSGTLRATHAVAKKDMALTGFAITPKTVESLIEFVLQSDSVSKLSLKGLSDRRAQVWPGGLAILAEILNSLQVSAMSISHGALREGLLYDMLAA